MYYSFSTNPNPKPIKRTTTTYDYSFPPAIPQMVSPSCRLEVPLLSPLEKIGSTRSLSTPFFLDLSSLTTKFQKYLSTIKSKFIDPLPLHSSVNPNHVFTGNFAPVDELEPTNCTVQEGELPRCLNGVYIRNGSNPQHKPANGRPLHFFEGDGMLHSLKLSGGQAIYCSRYVKTYKYMLEKEAGFPIFPNMMSGFYSLGDIFDFVMAIGRVLCGHINLMRGFGLANTSLAFFAHKLLALGESDLPYVIDVTHEGSVETLGRWDFDQKLFASMTAHPKVDNDTKETFAFQCNPVMFPYITYFHLNEDGEKQKDVPILSVNRPTLIHDFAVTKRFAVFAETQLTVAPTEVMLGRGMPVVFDPRKTPRIGIIPRYATDDSNMKWFPVPGFNAMHVINSWESGDDDDEEIVLVAPNVLNIQNVFPMIEKVHFSLEKLTINLRTGNISRKKLSDRNLELGSINASFAGKKNRYAYLGIVERIPKMSGLVKIDLEKECEVSRRFYGPGCFGGEPLFVPRDTDHDHDREASGNGDDGFVIGTDGDGDDFEAYDNEDDGFVMTYVHDEISGESKFLVMDAKSPNLDVLVTVKLPRRVPYGFHSLFVSENCLPNW